MVWFRCGCTASCGWNVRCVGVRGDAWSVMLSPCNTIKPCVELQNTHQHSHPAHKRRPSGTHTAELAMCVTWRRTNKPKKNPEVTTNSSQQRMQKKKARKAQSLLPNRATSFGVTWSKPQTPGTAKEHIRQCKPQAGLRVVGCVTSFSAMPSVFLKRCEL